MQNKHYLHLKGLSLFDLILYEMLREFLYNIWSTIGVNLGVKWRNDYAVL